MVLVFRLPETFTKQISKAETYYPLAFEIFVAILD